MQITIPEKVRNIINKLQDEGYEAYAVGGCVRDCCLGLVPNDWDITTNALPEQVRSLFRRTVDIGIKHGTVKVMIGNEGFEITTYRIDGAYEDGRHPNSVTFTGELKEDLRRRDFTINAMAYSEKDGLIDLFGGVDDLKAGVIRAVGDPEERFTEDALRMLRALRFSARFGYEIEESTKEAIRSLAPNLSAVSAERIREETEKLICSDNPDRMRWAYELGITRVYFPEWDKMMECEQNSLHHFTNVGEHTICAMNYLVKNYRDIAPDENRVLRLATILHDMAKPVAKTTGPDGVDHFKGHPDAGEEMAEAFLRRLKYDNDTIGRVRKLVRYHDDRPALTYPSVRRFIGAVGTDNMDALMKLKYADLYAHSDYMFEEKLYEVEKLGQMYETIIRDKDCLCVKDLAVSGYDLIEHGVKAGPELGMELSRLLEKVLDDPSMNEKTRLLELLHGQA